MFNLFSSRGTLTIASGTTAVFREKKPDGNVMSVDATIDVTNKTVTLTPSDTIAKQITAIAGKCCCEISLQKNNDELNTANFVLLVEKAPVDIDEIPSDSVLRELYDVADQADEIFAAAEMVEDAVEELATLIDPTLTQAGKAADAKATGDRLNDLWEEIGGVVSINGNMVHLEDIQSEQESEEIEINILPVQNGTGIPSSSNIRTISGRSSVAIIQFKKNILSFFIDGYVPSVSSGQLVRANGARSDYIQVNELTEYTISLKVISGVNSDVYVFYYDKNKTFLSYAQKTGTGQTTTLTFTTPANTAYVMCRLGSSANISSYISGQLEFGSESTAYEAYSITEHTINLSTYAPIYGATLKAISGDLIITHGYIASYSGESISGPWISSKDVYTEGSLPSTGAQVVYPLNTPIEHHIAAQSITFFDGINNVCSDSGKISISFNEPKQGSIADKVVNLENNKIDKQQGVENSGKVLAVGYDGVVVPTVVSFGGLSDEIKEALLNCFAFVTWSDSLGQSRYDALERALYDVEEGTIYYVVGKGVDSSLGQIVDNPNRALTDPIPFINNAPIKIQLTNPGDCRFAAKIFNPDGSMQSGGPSFSPDYTDYGLNGWGRTNREQTFASSQGEWIAPSTNGVLRFLFANNDDPSGSLPTNLPTGKVIVCGTEYKLMPGQGNYPMIRASFNPGGNYIDINDDLNSLKDYLLVSYYSSFTDGGTVLSNNEYELTGRLSLGSNTITVKYNGLTTKFKVPNVIDYYNSIMQWSMSLGNLELVKGGPVAGTGNYSGQIAISNYNSSSAARRGVWASKGKKAVTIENSFTETPYYPIPIPNNCSKVTVTVTPNTQFIAPRVYRLDESTMKYTSIGNPGWSQGSTEYNMSGLNIGTNDFLTIGSKYNSAGTSYPTEPTEITVLFER